MSVGEIEIRSVVSQQTLRYAIEKTQFSIGGEWDNNRWVLEVKNLFYFRGEEPHEIRTPPDKRGPLFVYNRSISPEEISEKGWLRSLQVADAKFASNEIPFPAGISFGPGHLGVSEMTYSMTWVSDFEFRCQAHGILVNFNDDPAVLDGASFEFAIQLPFEGIWLESNNREDKGMIDGFYESLFGMMDFTKEFDMFTDAVVLRAGPQIGSGG